MFIVDIRNSTENRMVTSGTGSVTFGCEAFGNNLTSHWIVNGMRIDAGDGLPIELYQNETILKTNITLNSTFEGSTSLECVFDSPYASRNKSMLLTVIPVTTAGELLHPLQHKKKKN